MKKNILIVVLAGWGLIALTFLVRPSLAPAWLRFGISQEERRSHDQLEAARRSVQRLQEMLAAMKSAQAVAAAAGRPASPTAEAAGVPPNARIAAISGGRAAGGAAALAGLLGDQKATRLAIDALKIGQWRQYGSLFTALKLPGRQLGNLRELLAQRDASLLDATTLSQQAGVPVDQDLVAKINSDFGSAAGQLLGPTGAALAMATTQNPAAWGEVSDIQTRLEAMSLRPMNPQQMTAALAALAPTMSTLPQTTDLDAIHALIQSQEQSSAAVRGSLVGVLAPAQINVVTQRLRDNVTATRLYYYTQLRGAAASSSVAQAR